MIHVKLIRNNDGSQLECVAKGHAGFAEKGKDIVCAAVTCLLRTTSETLSKENFLEVIFEAPERGYIRLIARKAAGVMEHSNILDYAGNFLVTGFKRLQTEFPEYVLLELNA